MSIFNFFKSGDKAMHADFQTAAKERKLDGVQTKLLGEFEIAKTNVKLTYNQLVDLGSTQDSPYYVRQKSYFNVKNETNTRDFVTLQRTVANKFREYTMNCTQYNVVLNKLKSNRINVVELAAGFQKTKFEHFLGASKLAMILLPLVLIGAGWKFFSQKSESVS